MIRFNHNKTAKLTSSKTWKYFNYIRSYTISKLKKSSGTVGIPARVLKLCSSSLAKPLRNVFFLSFKTGKFPSCYKIANLQPVPKKGDPSDPGNYPTIAICSNLAKVMESILNKVKSYSIGNTFIRWLSDFLCNHSIRVVIDGINSILYPVNSGVPQGSVISPILFLLFHNDLFV